LLEREYRVEVSAVSHVVADLPDALQLHGLVEGDGESGHVGDGDAGRGAVADADLGDDQAGRSVQPDQGDRLGDLHHARLDQDRGDADGAVPAHRQAPGHLDEDDPPVGVRPARRLQDGAAHGGVAARLVHESLTDAVHVRHEVAATVEHGVTGDGAHAADDDPGGHPLGVRVDGVEDPAGTHQVQPWASAFSVAWRTSASCSVVRAPRGAPQGPPERPALPTAPLIAGMSSVFAARRSSGWSSRYSSRARPVSLATQARYSSAQERGKALVKPDTHPFAPASANSRTESSEPIRMSSPGASSPSWYA